MDFSDKKILYVEDDNILGFVTRDNLEQAGYRVTHCENGVEALKAFRKGIYDLCIFDIMLPQMDGFTLAERIREKNEHIPILFLTAKSLNEDKIKGFKLGGDDYITKPFSMEELLLKIEVFLKRNYIIEDAAIKESYTIGDYNFTYQDLMLTRGKEKYMLTQKEADLLLLFAQNQNKILKRPDILIAVWGENDYFLGRSLDVFISRLRKYLRKDKKIKLENIHGVGFRLLT